MWLQILGPIVWDFSKMKMEFTFKGSKHLFEGINNNMSLHVVDGSRFSGMLRTSEEGADTVIWLALQPKEKLVSGAFYFDRAEAPKHLTFAATNLSHALINSIVDNLRSLSALSSLILNQKLKKIKSIRILK